MSELLARYREMRGGEGRTVLIRGACGIGKTRLLSEFAATIRSSDTQVTLTPVLDYASSPFAPIVTVTEHWLRTRPALFEARPGLRRTLDSLVNADAHAGASSASERRRFFDGVAELFREVAKSGSATVIIDDLHLADASTYQLLYHIAVATRDAPFLLVASERSDATVRHPRDASTSASFERLDRAAVVDVRPLSDEACDALIRHAGRDRLDVRARSRITLRAEGNPLFAEELVRQALAEQDAVNDGGDVPVTAPGAAAARLAAARLGQLPAEARELLFVAAVIGRRFDADLLARCTRASDDALFTSLREAAHLGLIDETDDPLVFRFHHALIHETVYAQILEAERRRLHRRIFSDIAGRPQARAAPAAPAFHAYRSGDVAAALHYNELAGDQAAGSHAVELAIELFEQALSVLEEAGADAARVSDKLAQAYLTAGIPDRAIVAARRALACHEAQGDSAAVADSLLLLAEAFGQISSVEQRLETLARIVRVLDEAVAAPLRAKRCQCLAEIALAGGDTAAAIAACDEGLAGGDPGRGAATALANLRAQAFLLERRYDEAIEAQNEAVRIASSDDGAEYASSARLELGIVLSLTGKLAGAGEAFADAAREAAVRGAMSERALSIAYQAEMTLMRGEIDAVYPLIRELLSEARRFDQPMIDVIGGRVGLYLGLLTGDSQLLRDVVDVFDLEERFRSSTPERYFPLSGAFAQYLAAEGRIEEAREVLRRFARRLPVKRLRNAGSAFMMLAVAALGDEADIAGAREPIANWFAPYGGGFAHLFDAIVAARFNDASTLTDSATAAARELRQYEFRPLEGLALELAGRYDEALAMFETIGARADARRVREEMTPKNRLGRPANALTAREREVASLVAEGLTNRAISERLFVSEKTVETHVAAIFSKVGVRERRRLGPRLELLEAEAR